MTLDTLAQRMKAYEQHETDRAPLAGLPILVRVDGRGFSTFTRGMTRPYDQALADLMVATTKHLVAKTGALIGYTQSDEISLILQAPDGQPSRSDELFFGGRLQKLTSVIAGLATARFLATAMTHWPDRCARELPVFDARVFPVPDRDEAANALLWRQSDATKNAISMAAQAYYSHTELLKKTGSAKQEMLFLKGVNFNDYPARFRRGIFVRRREVLRPLTDVELAAIPAPHRPTGPILRKEIQAFDLPPLYQVANRVAVIFDDATPQPIVEADVRAAASERKATRRQP